MRAKQENEITMTDSTVLDSDTFANAVEIFGPEEVRSNFLHVLSLFGSHISDMKVRFAETNPTEWAEKVHQSLGHCSIFGAVRLYELGRKLETQLRANGCASAAELDELLQALSTTKCEVESRTR